MRGSTLIVLGAASHILCVQAAYSSQTVPRLNDVSSPLKVNLHSNETLLQLRGGGEVKQLQPAAANSGDIPSSIRWWTFHNRRAARKAANEMMAPEDTKGVLQTRRSVFALDIWRRLRRWLSALVDIATLKRLRQNRQARQGVWQHGGAIPVRYRPLVQELRTEIARNPGLERRARRVNHELDNIALARFLEAAYWSLEHDGKRVSDFVADSIAWRESVGAHRLKKEDVAAEGPKGTILVKGHDLQRRPVVYFRPAFDGKMDGDNNAKLMIYTLERATRLMPRGTWQYTIIIDCKGMGLSHMPPLAHIKRMFKMLSHHYPMRLGNVIFTNVGPSVMLCWRVVSPLLQARTKNKMRFVPSSKLETISKYIHPSQLLPFVGGASTWLFDPSVYFSNDAASL